MGILKLMDFIKKKFPRAISYTNMESYQNKTLAIDASNWIYQFLIKTQTIKNQNVQMPTDSFGNQTGHLIGILSRIQNCLENNILPIWVFDGAPPQEKFDELRRRKQKRDDAEQKSEEARESGQIFQLLKMTQRTVRITHTQKQDAIKLVRLAGMPTIQAPSEAEPQCSWLVKNGLAHGTVSEDLDTLAFGCEKLIRNFNKRDECVEVNLSTLLEGAQLSYKEFVDFCILCGCDYSSKISGIGPVNAYKLIHKHKNIENVIQHIFQNPKLRNKHQISDDFNYLRARSLFIQPQIAEVKKQEIKLHAFDEQALVNFLFQKDFSETRVQNWISKIKNHLPPP